MDSAAPLLEIVGRAMLGSIFIIGGLRHLPVFSLVTERFRVRGVPLPKTSLTVGTVFQIVVGAFLMLGLFQTASAIGLIAFTIAASVIVHNFWDMEGEARRMALFWWQSNVGIMGGLLVLAA